MSKAPVLLVFGQSNAHASGVRLPENERILSPLSRVLTLPRAENQFYSPAAVIWRGYTTEDTNLGECQDHTDCFPTAYARLWEDNAGSLGLPDLYVIRISIGAQGVTEGYMWHPLHPRRLIPGPRGVADLALFPFSCDVIRRAFDDLRSRGLEPVVTGLHWFGTEEETGVPTQRLDVLPVLHRVLIRGWREAAGCKVPVILYKLRCVERSAAMGEDPRCIETINASFARLAEEEKDVFAADPRDCPLYDPSDPINNGLYADGVHLSGPVNRWLAETAFRKDLSALGLD
ncbi:MAG: hypothetical protein E7576_00785 [Ruminococcaceae bacterium]|jgi:hypothetical protein|nr:hypothetical protein [Oscillospiraceae bacterium]